MTNCPPKKLVLSLLLLGFFFQAAPLWAANPNDYLATRTYFGILGTFVNVDNSTLFNGQNYYASQSPSYEIGLIPRLDSSLGFGLMIGHREDAYAMEISYCQSSPAAFFGPASLSSSTATTPVQVPLVQGSALYQSINLDFKRYFLTESQTQPFVNLGVSFPWIVVPDAVVDADGNYADLTLAGLGLNLGVGLEYYLTPNFSLTGGATQRWASFDQYKNHPTFASPPTSPSYVPLHPYGGVASDSGSGLIFTLGATVGIQ